MSRLYSYKQEPDPASFHRLYRLITIFCALSLCLAIHLSATSADAITEKKHILVLNSYHKGLSWTDNIVRGIESVFPSDGKGYEISFEYMGTKRNYSEKYLQVLYEAYRLKYDREKFDVIIACDNDAYDFLQRHRRTLFTNTPIVFCGINYFRDSMVWDKERITGVVEETDIKGTLEVALKLLPETSRIYVINDNTTTGRAMKKEVSAVMPAFNKSVEFHLIEDFDIAELRTTIRNLPADSIILLLVVNRDKKGNFFAYEESLAFISSEAKVPIFSTWDFYLGGGIVGGMLTSGYAQGRTAAEMAQRIINGEKAGDISIVRTSPNKAMFDYRQMQRYGLNESRLPQDSTILYKPDTFLARHRGLILTIGLTIFILSVIIFIQLVSLQKRKRVEKALRESEEKYRDFYDRAPDMYHSLDRNGIIIDCNETEARMLGYRKEDMIGRPITDFLTPESRQVHEYDFPVIKVEKKDQVVERVFIRNDGSTFPASLHVYVEVDENNEFVKTKTIARDITESKHLEDELKDSRQELRNLNAHLQSVREEERRGVASEIHDELGQVLTTLKLDLSLLRKKLDRENSPLSHNVTSMSDLVDKTIESVQRISSELRPGVLDHLGLSDAIEWLAGEICNRKGLKYEVAIDPADIELDQNRSIAVFRIFQEALTNIVRHAEATHVKIHLTKGHSALMLEVRDNGIGLPEEKLTHHESYGLIGIKERARYHGGEARIVGVRGKGTTVDVYIPLTEEEETDVKNIGS